VGNYLYKSGWKKGQPVATPITLPKQFNTKLITSKAKPMLAIATLKRDGVHFDRKYSAKSRGAVIELINTHSKDYWVAFKNFRAIMQYNPSINYAMAVYQLSTKIKEAYGREKTQTSA